MNLLDLSTGQVVNLNPLYQGVIQITRLLNVTCVVKQDINLMPALVNGKLPKRMMTVLLIKLQLVS